MAEKDYQMPSYLRSVVGNFHFPLPSMNRLNQTEPATFSLLSLCVFFEDSLFLSISDNILSTLK
jgi:hypothetical protein